MMFSFFWFGTKTFCSLEATRVRLQVQAAFGLGLGLGRLRLRLRFRFRPQIRIYCIHVIGPIFAKIDPRVL